MSEGKYSRGVEKVIILAALDDEFRAKLLGDRAAALDSCGEELTGSERAVLEGIPASHLEEAIGNAEVPEPARNAFLRGIAAGAGALALLGAVLAGAGCSDKGPIVTGTRPDREHIEETQEEEPGEEMPSGK